MIAVLFEVEIKAAGQQDYLRRASALREELERTQGFIAAERFASLAQTGKLASLSWWRDEESITAWRNHRAHRKSQRAGRQMDFADYRITVLQPMRRYTLRERAQAELDPSKPVYVHCHSGLRSYIACRMLAGMGYDCYNLSGGWRLYDSVMNDHRAKDHGCYDPK